MTGKTNTKRALLLSVIALALCFTMFAGTTLAWFTDSVTTRSNIIASGTLKADLLLDAEQDGNYRSIAGEDGGIFSAADVAQNSTATLWEPGKTQLAYLAVSNDGTLAMKYNIIIDVIDRGLAGSLDYAIIDGATAANAASLSSWNDVLGAATATGPVTAGRVTAAPYGMLPAGESDYFLFAVHMREEAGNEYQGKEILFDLALVATQATVEYDSFDNLYDADAELPAVDVAVHAFSREELLAALAAVNAGSSDAIPIIDCHGTDVGNLNSYTFKNDVEIRNAIFSGTNATRWCYANNGAKVTFTGCAFNGSVYGAHFDGGNGSIVFNDCDLKGWNSFAGTITSVDFNNCRFSCSDYGSIRFYQNGTINSCTFSDDYRFIDSAKSGSVIRISGSNVTTALLSNNGGTSSQWFIDGVDVTASVGSH